MIAPCHIEDIESTKHPSSHFQNPMKIRKQTMQQKDFMTDVYDNIPGVSGSVGFECSIESHSYRCINPWSRSEV